VSFSRQSVRRLFIRPRGPDGEVTSSSAMVALPLLIRLRWLAVPGQVLALLGLPTLVGVEAPLEAYLVPLMMIVSNQAASYLRHGRASPATLAACLIVFDTLLLTAWLGWAGGAVNPFTILYLVLIVLAALVLGAGWTWGTAALSVLCFGLLVALEPAGSTHGELHTHLRGMWVAFTLAAGLTALFVVVLRRDLNQRERELAHERTGRYHAEQLAALSTVVGTAAHELATPVTTLALAAAEVEAMLAREAPELRDRLDPELEAMRHQAARCRQILNEMGGRAGRVRGEGPHPTRLVNLVEQSLYDLAPEERSRIVYEDVDPDLMVTVPQRALVRSMAALVRNACDASPRTETIRITAAGDGGDLVIEVLDRGRGMSDPELQRAGEPFFTTKPMGHGHGLGLYMTRSSLNQLGGTLNLERRPGRGIRAVLRLPADPQIVAPETGDEGTA